MAIILDGKKLAQKIKDNLKAQTIRLTEKGKTPGLAVIIVGNNSASRIYVNSKKRACAEIGIYSEEYALPEDTSEKELLELIEKLNKNSDIDGILVQLPLPGHIDEKAVINAISPGKDVDAFHPVNVGKIMIGDYDFLPCTPAGVIELINESGIDLEGKECVVIGRSNIVGKPMSMLLLHKNATVTICHSKTVNLAETVRRADVVVAAVGRAQLINGDMIKEGAVVIDVGMNRLEDNTLAGDVHFESCAKKAYAITPVPGGVGPMTIAMLMKNTVKSASLACSRGGVE
ncbi:MAG: bifunctional methylenetetrahydrofolate dehydrogenase/methenyltetrahydrofolate cyclohydrolase FolD [Firmicutes bacterium]|nr:bifunctional methylenetetrahydrofolate dehydrogenase/methenyltetrahydrofolate cyclohydrolase FolD [Bacillota bacterium]